MTTLRQPARLFRVALVFAATALVAGATLTAARAADTDYPTKPIKIIVPFPAGSGTDISARRLSQMIQEQTGQPAVVENKPGASGFIAAQAAATSPADGYTLFVTTNTTHAANASLFKKLPYDPIKDFAPISRIAVAGLVLVSPPTARSRQSTTSCAWRKRSRARSPSRAAHRRRASRARCSPRAAASRCCTFPTRVCRRRSPT